MNAETITLGDATKKQAAQYMRQYRARKRAEREQILMNAETIESSTDVEACMRSGVNSRLYGGTSGLSV